jgi:hypothetical protein
MALKRQLRSRRCAILLLGLYNLFFMCGVLKEAILGRRMVPQMQGPNYMVF